MQEQVFGRREWFPLWEWLRETHCCRPGGGREWYRGGTVRGPGGARVLTFRVVVALAPDATGELVAWTKRKSLSSRGQAPWTRQV